MFTARIMFPDVPPVYKSTGRAQEAHEAIRPTVAERSPDKVKPFLSRDQHRLYKLIWERFIASQMSPAVMDATTVDIQAGEYLFRASGSVIRFPGFLRVYKETEAAEQILPEVHEGELLTLVDLDPDAAFHAAAAPVHGGRPGENARGEWHWTSEHVCDHH